MFVINGKHTFAKVYLEKLEDLELSAREQIEKMVNHVAFKNPIAIMPDCHAGSGCVIGFTMKASDLIIPNVIGVDIGCGVSAINLGKQENFPFELLDNLIKKIIPNGMEINNNQGVIDLPSNTLNEFGRTEFNLKIREISDKIQKGDKNKYKYFVDSLGSLGGGNHFIEVNETESKDLWLTVHSGSRNFGHQVASYHQGKAERLCNLMHVDVPKGMEYLPMEFGGSEYLEDMQFAQVYAQVNREIILARLWYVLNKELHFEESLNNVRTSVHNYISPKDHIIRKGAIESHKDEIILIPLNMRDGIIVAKGKSNKDMNFSAPHGAGRIMGRNEAKKRLNMEEFQNEMKDVYTTSVSVDTLDEAPMAYKIPQVIYDNIKDTCEVLFTMKPVYNFKAKE